MKIIPESLKILNLNANYLALGLLKWVIWIKWVREKLMKLNLVHIWKFNEHYPGYTAAMKALEKDDQHQMFLKNLAPMLRSRENQVVLEFNFWESTEKVDPDGIYELRTYLLKVLSFQANSLAWPITRMGT